MFSYKALCLYFLAQIKNIVNILSLLFIAGINMNVAQPKRSTFLDRFQSEWMWKWWNFIDGVVYSELQGQKVVCLNSSLHPRYKYFRIEFTISAQFQNVLWN